MHFVPELYPRARQCGRFKRVAAHAADHSDHYCWWPAPATSTMNGFRFWTVGEGTLEGEASCALGNDAARERLPKETASSLL